MNQLYTQDAVSPLMIQPGEVRVRRYRELDLRASLAAFAGRVRMTVQIPVQRATR
ncbi:hypothetical protein ACFWQC_13400 [Nocardioides sp. NPDC058538]|uniref:hypothetical protein n=1 Tax=Nocardioides sp. NPDC058538 TaxID=3346542 RepID=UPI003655D7D9